MMIVSGEDTVVPSWLAQLSAAPMVLKGLPLTQVVAVPVGETKYVLPPAASTLPVPARAERSAISPLTPSTPNSRMVRMTSTPSLSSPWLTEHPFSPLRPPPDRRPARRLSPSAPQYSAGNRPVKAFSVG